MSGFWGSFTMLKNATMLITTERFLITNEKYQMSYVLNEVMRQGASKLLEVKIKNSQNVLSHKVKLESKFLVAVLMLL